MHQNEHKNCKKTNQPCNFGWVHPFQKEVSSLSVITCQLFGWFWFGFKAYRFSVLSFIHSHWVMHLQKSCAAAELLWLHLCSRQEVCLSLPCTWLRCWIMFSMRHTALLSACWSARWLGAASSTEFSWVWFFFSKNKILIEIRRWQIKNYQKYLIPAGNQRHIWFYWYLLSNRGKTIQWPVSFLVLALKQWFAAYETFL